MVRDCPQPERKWEWRRVEKKNKYEIQEKLQSSAELEFTMKNVEKVMRVLRVRNKSQFWQKRSE